MHGTMNIKKHSQNPQKEEADVRTNSDLCHLQHKLNGFYKRGRECLLRGTDWVFKYSGLRFVFKGLIFMCFVFI